MDLSLTEGERAFRAEVRNWLAANVPSEPLPSMDTAEGFEQHRGWERKLFDAGLSAVSWPAEFGGRDASMVEWLLFEEEYYAAAAPGRVAQNGVFLLAPTLFAFGTPEQQRRVLPAMASGEQIWAQAWSEPGAGSDLAAVRSVAEQVEGGWRVSGQKTWSTRAAFADRAFGLFRSDRAVERHRGLTYLMFDLRAPEATVRPVAQLDGEPGFAEIFMDGVFVPDEDVIGPVGEGWRVAMSATSSERGLTLRSPGRFLSSADRLLDLWRERSPLSPGGRGVLDGDVVDAWIAAQAYRLFTYDTVGRMAAGRHVAAESSLNKVFWSELDVSLHETALRLLGTEGELDGPWSDGYLFSLAGPIYAGTNEIQRDIAAERLLGLPRSR